MRIQLVQLKNDDLHITPEIIGLLRRGNILAYDHIYNRYCHKLYLFALRILKDESDAEDIVQEVFIKLWEQRNHLDDHKQLNSFLFTITYNICINLLRKRISSTKYLEHLRLSSSSHNFEDQDIEAEINELKQQIEKLIGSLPERQKEVFLAHRQEGLTYSEIADKLGISENTVENHMSRALKFLRMRLTAIFPVIRMILLF